MFTLKDRKVGLNCLAFSPDGRTLAASGYRGVIQLWDLDARRLHATFQTANNCDCSVVFFLPNGKSVAVLNDGTLRLFDVRGESLGFRPEKDRRRNFCAAAVSPDRKRVCVAAGYHQSGLEQYALPKFAPIWPRRASRYGRATALSYSADGRFIVSGRSNGAVVVAESATGEVHFFEQDMTCGEVKAVALSPDGQYAGWCAGTQLFLWRVDTAEEIHRHRMGGRTFFLSVAWHPSGDFFATANGDGKIDFWDARTGEHRQAFDWGVGKLHDVIFDATGDRAACCSKTGEIVVWDVDR
jgi:WD40 repeat protein